MKFALLENRVAGTAVGVVGALAFVAMANDGSSGANTGNLFTVSGLIGVLISVLLALFAARCFRLGVTAEGDHVLIRNVFRTLKVDRTAVVGVSAGSPSRIAPAKTYLELEGGRKIGIDALTPGLLRHNAGRAGRLRAALASALAVPAQ